MSLRWRRFLAIFLALVLATVLVACNNGDENNNSAGTDNSTGLSQDGGLTDDDDSAGDDDADLTEDQDEPGDVDVTDDQEAAETESFDFSAFDEDNDSRLNENEFGAATNALDLAVDDYHVYDTNGDNYIDQAEFDTFANGAGLDLTRFDEQVSEAIGADDNQGTADQLDFSAYDEDSDGVLSESEFNTLAADIDVNQNSFTTYDTNGDNYVDQGEFNAFAQEASVDQAMIDEQAGRANPPLGDTASAGESIQYLDRDEQVMTEDGTPAASLLTADNFIGMDLVDHNNVYLGEIIDGIFDMNGEMRYVVVDIEDEFVVQAETLLGDDTIFDEEVDNVLMSYNLLRPARVTAANADATINEDNTMQTQMPLRLVLLTEGTQDLPWVAQEIDAAVLSDQSNAPFLDPSTLGVDDEDFQASTQNELLVMSNFEGFDLSDHDLVNQNGDELGDIDELVVNLTSGRVAYATVDVGGFLGIGENTVAIPWDQVTYTTDSGDFAVNADATTLEQAPTVSEENLQTGLFDAGTWDDEFGAFWDNLS